MSDHEEAIAAETTSDPAITITSSTRSRKDSEQRLKQLLKEHHGSTKHAEVRQAIHELIPQNPTDYPTKSPHLLGDFICHTIPEFPGRLRSKTPEVIQYTLGRLSFGVFQPHNLVCTIRSVRQCIQIRNETKSGAFKILEYPVLMDITIHAPQGDLPAILSHDAVCYECPKQPHRLKVKFKGSTLMPTHDVLSNDNLVETWQSTFAGAYAKAKQQQNFLSKTLHSMLRWWFQITVPDDEEMARNQDHSVHFEMKRSPRGHLDILYMSDRARITRGNRGTLVVVEPMVCTSTV